MDNIHLIMCYWRRPENLPMTLKALDSQINKNFTFHVWNNNISDTIKLRNTLGNSVDIYNSPKNIGGIGRFHMAKSIGAKKIMFIDDDQWFGSTLIQDGHDSFEEKKVKSWWAWKINSTYTNRVRLTTGKADYCGTGGMLVDGDIFANPRILDPPMGYSFIEDLWLSMVATKMGWSLEPLDTQIRIIEDQKDQYRGLMNKKIKFYNEYKNGKIQF